MGDLVQYGAASAVYLHKRILRAAKAMELSGASSKKSITDGYIVTNTRTSGGTLSRVIDPPAFIGWQAPQVYEGLFYEAVAASVGDRDLLLPNAVASPDPVAVTDDSVLGFGVTGYRYVEVDSGYFPPSYTGTGFAGNCVFDGEWVYNVFSTTRAATSPDTAHIIAFASRWDTTLIDVSEAPPVPVKEANQRSIVLSDASYQAVLGSDIYIGSAAPQPRIDVVTNDLVVSVAGKREADASITPFRLLVGRVNYAEGDFAEFAWLAEIGTYRSVFGSGIHFGAVVTSAVTVSFDTGTLAPKTAAYLQSLDPLTGGVLATATVYEDAGEIDRLWVTSLCSSANALWLTRSANTPSTTTWASCELLQVVGTTITPVSLLGWCPISAARPGRSIITTLVELPRPGVLDLGGERLLVVVCSDAPTASGPVDWYCLEIDAVTLAVVETRGLIGTADSGSVYLSVVTPQVVVDDVVTRGAVLLANVANETKLSNDGGLTWRIIATGPGGTPVYRGNRLHPVTVGETL